MPGLRAVSFRIFSAFSDKGASVDRVRRRIKEVRAALGNLFYCNVKLIDLLEGAGISEEVPRAQTHYVEAEYNCSEVLKLAEHRVSVACALDLSSDCLEDNVDLEDSISQASQSTKKSSSTTASSARFKATARKAALMARVQVLNDGLELKRRQLQLKQDQKQFSLRAKISEVEAEERVYQTFEEKGGCSDRTSVVRSSVKKSFLNAAYPYLPKCHRVADMYVGRGEEGDPCCAHEGTQVKSTATTTSRRD